MLHWIWTLALLCKTIVTRSQICTRCTVIDYFGRYHTKSYRIVLQIIISNVTLLSSHLFDVVRCNESSIFRCREFWRKKNPARAQFWMYYLDWKFHFPTQISESGVGEITRTTGQLQRRSWPIQYMLKWTQIDNSLCLSHVLHTDFVIY